MRLLYCAYYLEVPYYKHSLNGYSHTPLFCYLPAAAAAAGGKLTAVDEDEDEEKV